MPKRIRIEMFPNPHFRKYHVTTRVSVEQVQGGMFGGSRHDPFGQSSLGETETEYGEDTKATVMRLYDIDGINSVGLDTFEVTLEIAPAFEWDELNTEIVDTVKEIAGWSDEEVMVDYLFAGSVSTEPVSHEEYQAEVDRQRVADRMFGF